jgi:murein L,D-transpeptidase YafK
MFLRIIGLLLLFIPATAFAPLQSFEEIQKKNDRVAGAYERKEELIKMKCRSNEIPEDSFGNLLIRVFKAESILEVWVRKPDGKYIEFNEYKIYASSGKLGPKRREGDHQVPEGYYYVNDFNPGSNYYLSLGIDYPNLSDRILSDAPRKGGDIYIHGARISAGCLAMSNYYIEDIYICAVKAKSRGQDKIPVEIFPFKPIPANFAYYLQFADCKEFEGFWRNLAIGYRFFEQNRRVPDVSIDADGAYRFSDPVTTRALK